MREYPILGSDEDPTCEKCIYYSALKDMAYDGQCRRGGIYAHNGFWVARMKTDWCDSGRWFMRCSDGLMDLLTYETILYNSARGENKAKEEGNAF